MEAWAPQRKAASLGTKRPHCCGPGMGSYTPSLSGPVSIWKPTEMLANHESTVGSGQRPPSRTHSSAELATFPSAFELKTLWEKFGLGLMKQQREALGFCCAAAVQGLGTPGGGMQGCPGGEQSPPRAWGRPPAHGHPGQLANAGQRPSHFHVVPDDGQPRGHIVGAAAAGGHGQLGVTQGCPTDQGPPGRSGPRLLGGQVWHRARWEPSRTPPPAPALLQKRPARSHPWGDSAPLVLWEGRDTCRAREQQMRLPVTAFLSLQGTLRVGGPWERPPTWRLAGKDGKSGQRSGACWGS